MLYRTNEFSFDLPASLNDRSVNIFSLTDDGVSEFSLVATRAPLGTGETIETYTDRQISGLTKTLSGFKVNERRGLLLKGVEAVFLSYIWSSNGSLMHQLQVSFVASSSPEKTGLVVMLTATCRNRFTPEWLGAFQNIIASINIRSAGA